jgi:RNA polymerase sigma factor (sigma-70 family)
LFGSLPARVSSFKGEYAVGSESVQVADAAAFLEANLPLVEGVVAEVARRYRVRGDALAEFRSLVFLKLVEQDYGVLRRFQGASSLRTYLAVVAQRVLLDHRNHEWGRWRASAAASRLGPVAVRLERLVTRDGFTPAEAIATVSAQTDVSGYADFIETLARRGQVRRTRAALGEDAIPECLDLSPGPHARLERQEQASRAGSVRTVVRDALRSLPPHDHLLVTLRFRDGLSVADAAQVLGLDAKPLYRRIDRILERLHSVLCTDELRGELARELARGGLELWPAGESGWWRQSNPVNGPVSNVPILARSRLSRRRPAGRLHRRVGARAVQRDRAASL